MVTSPKDEEETTLFCLFNQTKDKADPFKFVSPNKQKSEQLYCLIQTLERNYSILRIWDGVTPFHLAIQ
jgi:hypothetical protein